MSAVAVLDRELSRLEGLWDEGLEDSYRSYLEAVAGQPADMQPRLALAAALVEVGLNLQGLGGPAAPPSALLMGDLCLARSSRILTDWAAKPVQVAFARAVEELSSAAAARVNAPSARELLVQALAAR